jgi:hypothetical protein
MATYPAAINSFTNPAGTNTVDVVDHALQHTNVNNDINGIETVLGTTAGTSVLKNFSAGNFPARINVSNVLQQRISGTLDNGVLGTPAITSGTISSALVSGGTVGTAQTTGGTIGTAQHTGGTVTSAIIGTNSIVGGTMTSVVIGTPLLNNFSYLVNAANYTTNSLSFVDVDSSNFKGTISCATGTSKVRVSFFGSFISIAGTATGNLQVLRNGTAIFNTTLIGQNTTDGYTVIDTLDKTLGTYAVQWKTNQGTLGLGNAAYSAAFSVEEIKAG